MVSVRQLSEYANQLIPITVDQYEGMRRAGIIVEDARTELLDGLLVRKDRSSKGDDPMGIGHRHALIVEILRDLNESARGAGVHVRAQQPVQIPRFNVPEPDASIVSGSKYDYTDRNPSAADVLSVVEVADSSLDFDRSTKRSIYATAGIPQYVIVNLVDSQVEVMTGPQPDGTYAHTEIIEKGGIVRLNLGGDRSLDVNASQLLP